MRDSPPGTAVWWSRRSGDAVSLEIPYAPKRAGDPRPAGQIIAMCGLRSSAPPTGQSGPGRRVV